METISHAIRLALLALIPLLALAMAGPAAAQQDDGESALSNLEYNADVSYTLRTDIAEGRLVYVGVGGDIDGQVNPALRASKGQVVQITLVNGDGAEHDLVLPDFGVASDKVRGKGASTVVAFRANKDGGFVYYCSLPGHRLAGMEGSFSVGEQVAAEETGASVARAPTDMPPPIERSGPATVQVELEAQELAGRLASGTMYRYWTFNGTVPGPMIRARVGDTVELSLKNADDSRMTHSIDLHAVTGPGGGATLTQAAPGERKTFTFKALQPGLYVYHCATPMVAHHIASGMYGLILIEPEGGLPPVDHEFYVMQGEIYSQEAFGTRGELEFSVDKLLGERPEYMVFNGAVGALTEQHPMQVDVGDSVRIYFGVGGPNKTSSFHVIGEIFERVYDQASLTSPPLTDVQTTTVAPGGATVVEFGVEVPGRYILVDHALSRVERGLAGFILAEGEEQPGIYREGGAR